MGSINRYIFRATIGAFGLVLVSLTAVIWVTQALRDFNIITGQGQSVPVFLAITSLLIPVVALVIAPIALLIAVAYVLNKLATDSEIIVMHGAGMSPWVLFRGFLVATVLVSILVASISAYFAPLGLRVLHDWLTAVRADVVSNIVKPGRFTPLEAGVTFFIRERSPDGQLHGVLLDDQRNPDEGVTVLADVGEILQNDDGTFLILQKGDMQRHEVARRDPSLVVFERYAYDLSQFSGGPQTVRYSAHERYLWQLLFPAADDPLFREQPGRFRAELYDRLIAPLYPIAFMVLAYAYLGAPRTNRQSRAFSLLSAIGAAAALRGLGFVSTILGVNFPWVLSLQYLGVALAVAFGFYVIGSGMIIEAPAFATNAVNALSERFARRAGKAT